MSNVCIYFNINCFIILFTRYSAVEHSNLKKFTDKKDCFNNVLNKSLSLLFQWLSKNITARSSNQTTTMTKKENYNYLQYINILNMSLRFKYVFIPH